MNSHAFEAAAHQYPFFSSDSRRVNAQTIFIALKGEKFDGHLFLKDVFEKNCPVAIVSQDFFNSSHKFDKSKLIAVQNTHEAHRILAAEFRKKFKGTVIAVGGSSGKTTTKEFLWQVLSKKFTCIKTEKSQNGELGIPLTLEKLGPSVQIAIIEVGIDGPGDMRRHAELVSPDIAILTSIGEEHLNLLKNIETVFNEERILFDVTLARDGKCFAPETDPLLSQLKGITGIELINRDSLSSFTLPISTPHSIQNASLVVAVAKSFGMKSNELQSALDSLSIPQGRGTTYALNKGGKLFADHYNSNPSSLRAGLKHASVDAKQSNLDLHLILGDMLDLGEASDIAHQDVATDIIQTRCKTAFLIGPQMNKIATVLKAAGINTTTYANSIEAKEKLPFKEIQNAYIYAKGSRGMALETALREMVANIS